MIQTVLIFTICFLLLAILVGFGALLLTAGFNSKDQAFFEVMKKVKSWRHPVSYNTNDKKCLLIENKNTDKKDE